MLMLPTTFFSSAAPAITTPAFVGTPALGSRSSNAADGTTDTYAFTSTTGHVLVRCGGRVNSNPFAEPVVKWNGAAVTRLAYDALNGGQRPWAWLGVIRGGATGAHNVTAEFGKSVGHYLIRIDDLDTLAASHAGAVDADALNTSSTTVGGSLTPQATSSRLVGMGLMLDGGLTLTPTGGWTEQQEAATGATVDTSVVASFVTKVGGAAGVADPCTWTAGSAADDRAFVLAELKG